MNREMKEYLSQCLIAECQDRLFCSCKVCLDQDRAGLIQVMLGDEDTAPPVRQWVYCERCMYDIWRGWILRRREANSYRVSLFTLEGVYRVA